MESQIVELPGYLKRDPAEPWVEKPLKKYGRFTSTSVENEQLFGGRQTRTGPMTKMTPQKIDSYSHFTKVGQEAQVTPTQLVPHAKATSLQAKLRVFGESSEECNYLPSRKARPSTVLNAFCSSEWLGNERNF
jgi:hypothetical protein